MVTSNDEMEAAQVVANWLRELADRYPCGVPLEKFLGSLDVGVLAGHCGYLLDSDDIVSVADLIDPTCHKVIPNEMEGYVFCSKCGVEIGEHSVPNYCPNCRARVVSGNGE